MGFGLLLFKFGMILEKKIIVLYCILKILRFYYLSKKLGGLIIILQYIFKMIKNFEEMCKFNLEVKIRF